MTRNQKLIAIIVPGLLFVAWRSFSLLGGGTATPSNADAAPLSDSVPSPLVAKPDPRWQQQEAMENSAPKRDPFFSPNLVKSESPSDARKPDESPKPPAWKLTGIAGAGAQRTAILAGRLVSVGETLEVGYRVVRIDAQEVAVRRGRWEYVFRLGQSSATVRSAEGAP